jgi:hypothetical protein
MATFSTVLGFDLACLATSICGQGFFPRFLIHDSPREADIEEPMYHELFKLVAEWESEYDGREPSFQYIVTTTTRPPDVYAGLPWTRLELDARKPDGRLLGIDF